MEGKKQTLVDGGGQVAAVRDLASPSENYCYASQSSRVGWAVDQAEAEAGRHASDRRFH